jgi:uncharacterized membrane protein YphA (DoxX/SURF4 family)
MEIEEVARSGAAEEARKPRSVTMFPREYEDSSAWLSDSLVLLGRVFVAVSMLVFGIQEFRYAGYIEGLELVPKWIPLHSFCAYLTGMALIAAAFSIVLGKRAQLASTLLAVGFSLTLLLARGPGIAAILPDLRERTRVFETLTMCGGCLILAAAMDDKRMRHTPPLGFARAAGDVGRIFFAVSMAVFGLSHLVIPAFIATLIPAWIPWHMFWAYATAIGFFAAALSFATKQQMRIAGISLGLMMFLWFVLLHVPRVVAAIHNGDEWNSAFVALAVGGFSLVLAGAAQGRRDS